MHREAAQPRALPEGEFSSQPKDEHREASPQATLHRLGQKHFSERKLWIRAWQIRTGLDERVNDKIGLARHGYGQDGPNAEDDCPAAPQRSVIALIGHG